MSRIGAGLQTLQPLALELRGTHVQSLCLHANSISRLNGLHMLDGLKDLNLSSNQLRELEGLQTLTSLTSLNLSSNRLSTLDKLQPLSGLNSLNVSYNAIEHLRPLSALRVSILNMGAVHCLHLVLPRCNRCVSVHPTLTFLNSGPWRSNDTIRIEGLAWFADTQESGFERQYSWVPAGAGSSRRAARSQGSATGWRVSRQQRLRCARLQVQIHILQ